MTTQQKLEKLKEKIQKAVPEIMELKFGCEIYIEGCEYKFIFCCKENGKYILKTENDGYTIIPIPSYIIILGRPITLEDVLRTMKKRGKDSCGNLYDNSMIAEIVSNSNWKLNKPLNQQPQETIKTLYELICK